MTLASLQQQKSIADQQTDWSTALPFNQFDPSFGLLQNINIGLVGDVSAWIQLQNLDLAPAAFSVAFPGLISVLGPGNTVLASVAPTASAAGTLAANSGTILAGLTDTATSQVTLAAGPVGDTGFVGTGTLALPVTATASLHATGPANLDLLSHASAGASVTLDYNYDAATGGTGQQSGGGSSSGSGISVISYFIGSLTPAQVFSFADRTTGWSDQIALRQFDPSLGQLLGIDITLTNDIVASIGAENLGPDAAAFTSTQSATATLGFDGIAPGLTSQAVANDSMALAAFDGSIDDAGNSGRLDQGITQTTTNSLTLSAPAQLGGFLGGGTMLLPVSVTGSSTVDGPGNLSAQLRAQGGATISVSYQYIPGYASGLSIGGAGSVRYAAGQAATPLSPDLVIADSGDSVLAYAKVTLTGGAAGDVPSADTAGTGITASYDASSETLQLTGQASVAAYQQVLRSAAFASTAGDPSLGGTDTSRNVSWYAIDSLGNVAAPAGSSIAVTPQPAQWVSASDGAWSSGSLWSSAPQAPGAEQDVAITQAGSYTIDVTGAQSVHSVLLDAPGAVLRLDAPLRVLAGLTLEAGTLLFEGGSLSAGSVVLDGGTVAGSGVVISVAGTLALNGGVLVNATTVSAAAIVSQAAGTLVSLQPASTAVVTPSTGESAGIIDAASDTIVQTLPPNTDTAMQFLSMAGLAPPSGTLPAPLTGAGLAPAPGGSMLLADIPPPPVPNAGLTDMVSGSQGGGSGAGGIFMPPLVHVVPGDAVSIYAP